MSFAKSKRFPYSPCEDPPKENSRRRSQKYEERWVSCLTDQEKRNKKRSAAYAIYFHSPSSHLTENNNREKYFIDDKGNVTFCSSIDQEEKEHSITFEEMQKEIKELSLQRNMNQEREIEANNAPNTNATSADNIGNLIRDTETKINTMLEDVVKITKDQAETQVRKYLYSLVDWNHQMMEEMKQQCGYELKQLTHTVTNILRHNVSKEEDGKRMVTKLMQKNDELKNNVQYLDTNYRQLLRAADQKIEEQNKLIGTLKAELEQVEMNLALQKAIRMKK